MNILRTPAINASLQRRISADRLTKYLAESANDLDQALSLYERNTRLSEALYTPLQSLEVCLRNTIDEQMVAAYGAEWLTNGVPPLAHNTRDSINSALTAFALSPTPPTHSDLIAELKFSFWVSLLGPGYDATLWRRVLYKSFQVGGGRKRSVVQSRLNALRRFRNRVAHHEPIFHKADQMHKEIIETIGWMCADTRAWTVHHCRFPLVFAAP